MNDKKYDIYSFLALIVSAKKNPRKPKADRVKVLFLF